MTDNEQPECTNVEEKKVARTKYIIYFFIGIFVIGLFIMMARVSTGKSKSAFQSPDAEEVSDGETDSIAEHMVEDNHYQLYDEIEAFIGKQAEYIASQN